MTTRGCSWLLCTLALALALSLANASTPLVEVTLDGPVEGWYDDDLTYTANGTYGLDGDTQREVQDGSASVSDQYLWSYAPAQLVAGGGEDDTSATLRYSQQQAGTSYVVRVTYRVTITYKDNTFDTGCAAASRNVYIKSPQLSVTSSKSAICAGGKPSAPHQTTITASVTGKDGAGVAGCQIAFSADHQYNQTAPSFSPQQATTGADGKATTTLTSGDGVVDGKVKATWGTKEDTAPVAFQEPYKELSFWDPQTGEPLDCLYADGQSRCKVVLAVMFDGVPVAAHDVDWTFAFWTADKNPCSDPSVYEGTGQAPYGTITPTTSTTDGQGQAYAIYTVGTVGGSIEFTATDANVFAQGSVPAAAGAAGALASAAWQPTKKTDGLGGDTNEIPVQVLRARWMLSDNYQTERPWQWHIALNGETLYPMVELKPKVAHGRVPEETEIRIWSGGTDTEGFTMRLKRQSGPDANGVYKYWADSGQEPKIGPETSAPRHVIGVCHDSHDSNERTTHDNSDPTDSNALTWGNNRGNGRCYENEDETTLRADLEYMQCAGIEKVHLCSTDDTSKKDAIPAKNQADLLYFSGHGSSVSGRITSGVEPLREWINYSDIGMSNWQIDLDTFVIAACSVLNIAEKTGHDTSVGLGWANACIRNGPLTTLCGYHGSAPGDAGGYPQQIAAGFAARLGYAPTAWRDANNAVINTWWCAIDSDTYYWHFKNALGIWCNGEEPY